MRPEIQLQTPFVVETVVKTEMKAIEIVLFLFRLRSH